MGSHGGGSVSGQLAVLAGLGVDARRMGFPVCRQEGVAEVAPDVPVSRSAMDADAVVLINRVKEHSILEGGWGSGLRKMAVVGLGGAVGAQAAHHAGLQNALQERFPLVAAGTPLAWGLALLEDGAGRLLRLVGGAPADFATLDAELLAQARRLAPTMPFAAVDALVVGRMGKDISGVGMDPAVIGRHRRRGGAAAVPDFWLGVLRLTSGSAGNAIGVGMADMVTERLATQMDHVATRSNARASGWLAGAEMPAAVAASDRALVQAACRQGDRVALILDTGHLQRFLVSSALAADAVVDSGGAMMASGPSRPLPFDGTGQLLLESLGL